MNRYKTFILCNVLVGVLTVGCVRHSRFTVIEPPKMPFGQFGQVQVNDFTTTVKIEKSEDQEKIEEFAKIISDQVRVEVATSGYFAGASDQTLIVDGILTTYQPARAGLRWAVGFGAGEGLATVRVTFKDQTGVLVSSIDIISKITSHYGNIVGRQEATERVTYELKRFLATYKEGETRGPLEE